MMPGVASIAWGNARNSKQLLEIYVRAFCSLVAMSLGRSLWVESDTRMSLGRGRWHAVTPKCRMPRPLALSDARMSHDEAAGTQRRQKVA